MEKVQKRISKSVVKKYLFVLSIMIIPLASFAFFYVYINFSSFFLAFQKLDANGEATWVAFDNFKEFFLDLSTSGIVGTSIFNSIKFFWITFLIDIPLYILFSYYFAKKMPFSKTVSVIVMLPQVVSGFVYALIYSLFVDEPLIDLMASLGVQNFPNLIQEDSMMNFNNLFFSIWVSFGSATLIFTNAINNVDQGILESASIDGANDVKQFFTIILPLIWPTFSTYTVTGLVSMFTWSGNLLTFYELGAKPHTWGLGYYFTRTLMQTGEGGRFVYLDYPMIATSGLFVTIITIPIVYGAKFIMNKLDRTKE